MKRASTLFKKDKLQEKECGGALGEKYCDQNGLV
jgi:hypothetical protein